METENPNQPSFPIRPTSTPFAAPPSTAPYGFRPMAPGVASDAARPPPMSSSIAGPFQTSQMIPPHNSFGGLPNFPPSSSTPPFPLQQQSQADVFPRTNMLQPSHPPVSSYPHVRPTFQPGFSVRSSPQPSPLTQPTFGQAVGFPPPPGGYVPGPPPQLQHPGSAPPISNVQGLAEDFNSLSIGSIPGSYDTGLDSKVLPRPFESDVQNPLSELFPMNCSSRYLRLTTSGIPNSQSLASRWHLTLGAVVCPLAEASDGEEVPMINFTTTGIIRCRRCRTYVNPFVTFSDSGRKWRCNMCQSLNDVHGDYFAHLDATGRRIDLNQRPELTTGCVEFIAPAEYMVRPPMPPTYFFLIDVSISSIKNGMIEVIAQTIKKCLDSLPGYPRTQIGFITYDSTIHFYNMKSSLTQPQMLVVSDPEDTFVPLPDDLLVNLSECRDVIDTFLDSLPSMFQDNVNVESALGPALRAVFMVMMAADFTKYQIAVNVYTFSDKYTDVATLGTLSKYTGGQVYHYPSFQAAIHKDKLSQELTRDLTRETAWEAVMRIRCGKGVRFTTYHGNFMLRSTDLIALPAVDCDKAYAMQLSLEETLLTTQTVYFQVALLYTSSSGERRIRVQTAVSPVVSEIGDMYRLADIGAIVSVFSRLAIEKSLSTKLEEARSSILLRIVKALREYRNLYAVQHRMGGRMIYPESLKLLPLYGLALSKSTPLRGGYSDVQLDERCASGFTMMALPVAKLLKLLYPNLIRVDEFLLRTSPLAGESENMLKRLPLTIDSLAVGGLYIYDDGFRFVIWFGRNLSTDIIKCILGDEFAADLSKVYLQEQDNEVSRKLMGLLRKFRQSDPSYYQLCHLVRQGEQPREGFFLLRNLIEDQVGGTNSYMDWIVQLHRQVQQNA
ncbi:hypothetical protein DM860_014793 [Cuscuta australis]|uniref:Protein transport protein Sec24-like At3g07100 n=1 Tax=Cuscuta australis TaxID=267555 RepID=A0A328CZQ6_9ASTE|nr:hypothetical protein DM860_014793 [Cuscuta australis]